VTRFRVLLGAAALATLGLPLVLSTSQLSVFLLVCLATVVGCGLTLLVGFAGQVSLGHAAFYAIGAYTAALLARDLQVPPLLALAAAPLSSGVAGLLVGWPLLRLRGHALSFGTLAFQLISLSVLSQAKDITGGDIGLVGIPALGAGPLAFTGPEKSLAFAYVGWTLAALAVACTLSLTRSRVGRALRALATSEIGATASGVSVRHLKLQVFTLSAAFAGVAGAIFAFYVGYVAPGSFPLLLSVQFLIMVTVGGWGSALGAPVGACIVLVSMQALVALGTQTGMPRGAPVIFSYALYAVALIAVLRLRPRGVVAGIAGARR